TANGNAVLVDDPDGDLDQNDLGRLPDGSVRLRRVLGGVGLLGEDGGRRTEERKGQNRKHRQTRRHRHHHLSKGYRSRPPATVTFARHERPDAIARRSRRASATWPG